MQTSSRNLSIGSGLFGLWALACNGVTTLGVNPDGGAMGGAGGAGGTATTGDASVGNGGTSASGGSGFGGGRDGGGGSLGGTGGGTAAGGSDASSAGGATTTTGGATGSTGGVTSSAGGATSSTGGVTSSTGGVTSSTGGVTSSAGGATSSAGGVTSSTGGATSSTGGATNQSDASSSGGAMATGGASGSGGSASAGGSLGTSDAGDGGLVVNPPSCAGIPKTCGASGSDDCCESIVVPAGSFVRDNGVNGNYPATVSAFRLDKYEVTVGRFRRFLAGYPGNMPAAGSGVNSHVTGDPGWKAIWDSSMPATEAAFEGNVQCTIPAWQNFTVGDDKLPMNCVDWFEAYAFCIWDGGRLPSELEWNYASAGGSEQRPYPWSTSPTDQTISPAYAVYAPAAAVYAEVGSTSPLGDGRWGHADLAGNEMEWVADWKYPYPATCNDCAFIDTNQVLPGAYRMTRGGSAGDSAYFQLTSSRWYWNGPTFRNDVIGLRCARNIP